MISSEELETTQQDPVKNSKPANFSKKWAEKGSGSALIGGREITPVDMLVNLEKKPLGCYFEGIKERPTRRRKIRKSKKCLDLWDAESSSTQSEGWISTSAGAPLKEREQNEGEDRLLGQLIQVKRNTDEKLKELEQEKISMKQRLAEESYLEQQENLAETWLGVIKKRSQLRNVASEDLLSCPRPTFRTSLSKHHTRIGISLLSKKFWRDYTEEAPMQKKKESSAVDNLDEDFGEKLVFIDEDED